MVVAAAAAAVAAAAVAAAVADWNGRTKEDGGRAGQPRPLPSLRLCLASGGGGIWSADSARINVLNECLSTLTRTRTLTLITNDCDRLG